jgi:hypothetical protein
VKVTFNVTLCPPPRVKGNVGPLIEKPPPVVWSAESVKFQERSFLSTTGTVELVPIATWPNDTVEGLAVTESLFTPVPLTSSTRVAFDALLENLIMPPDHPMAVGVKLTLRSTLCPASKTSGRLKLDVVNSELFTVNPETVTLVCPLFVTVTSIVSVWPTTIAPNRRKGGVHASCGVAAPALTGAMPRSAIAMPMVRKWNVRTRRDWMLDGGSRIPSSLKALRRED